MSGSTIDNYTQFIFDAMLSEDCYLGFSKGTPDMQWGVNTLLLLENESFPANMANTFNSASASSDLYFDRNSIIDIAGSTEGQQTITIGFVETSDVTFSNVQTVQTIGDLKLMYMGKNWAIIQGLSKYYYQYLTPSSSGSYYLFNYNNNTNLPVKILEKSLANSPYYVSNCDMYVQSVSGGAWSLAASGLQRTINVLGETYITGLPASELQSDESIFNDAVSAEEHKNILINSYAFSLVDESGSIILNDMKFVNAEETSSTAIYTEVTSLGNSQKYTTFSYSFANNELQYIKMIIGPNQYDEFGIWNEALPYESIIPTSDGNPPALDVSYLKNSLVGSSLFDINGFSKVVTADVDFVKEVNNGSEQAFYSAAGFTIEQLILNGSPSVHNGIVKSTVSNGDSIINLFDFNGFVVSDQIAIESLTYTVSAVDYTPGSNSITLVNNSDAGLNIVISTPINTNTVLSSTETDINAIITVAKTKDKDKALRYGFFNVLISKEVDLIGANSPTENIYRQLFIAYRPKDSSGNYLTADTYNGDLSVYGVNFNQDTWSYDNGLIIYISNKVPIYRKWASTNEQFKIII
jgi:hypothetical protein